MAVGDVVADIVWFAFFFAVAWYLHKANVADAKLTPEQRAEKARRLRAESLRAGTNSQLVCPHCQTQGYVRHEKTKQKMGISGGKATGAILTGGLSLFAVGLSRKQTFTKASCARCGSVWIF